MTRSGGLLSDLHVLASGPLAELNVQAADLPLAERAFSTAGPGPDTQMLFLYARNHADPRMPLLQHHLHAMDHRGAVHALRVESERALTDAMVVLRALLQRSDRLLVVQDGLDLPLASFCGNAPGSYLLLAAEAPLPGDPAI